MEIICKLFPTFYNKQEPSYLLVLNNFGPWKEKHPSCPQISNCTEVIMGLSSDSKSFSFDKLPMIAVTLNWNNCWGYLCIEVFIKNRWTIVNLIIQIHEFFNFFVEDKEIIIIENQRFFHFWIKRNKGSLIMHHRFYH